MRVLNKIQLAQGDITQQDTEAIVNAANSSLMGGGGVDGAIHRAGGPQILQECIKIREKMGECPAGEAVITSGGKLKAKYVIHTVGPIWRGGGHAEDMLLKNAYLNSLKLAASRRIKTVAFPSISTGAYGFPIERAARIAIKIVADYLNTNNHIIEKVVFVLFSKRDFEVYTRALSQIINSSMEN